MEKSSYPAGKRVFRIDDECYIIYLGTSSDDIKPFLRIGNSKNLEDKITSNIYNIVITESYTGNPAYEPYNLNISDLHSNRYVGENSTVDKLLKYLENYNINTENIPHFHDVKTGDHSAMLYMYDNGNLALSYNNKVLFNLHNIEKKDRHFIEKTGWMKGRLVKNSLRYLPDHFDMPAFSIVENTLLLHQREQLIAFDLPEHYYFSLARHGIDPDLITTVITSEASAGFFDLCKRKKHTKEGLNVLSANTTSLKSALELFTAKEPDPLKVKLGVLSDLSSGTAAGFKIQRTENKYSVTKNNFPGIIISNSQVPADDKQIVINTQKKLCVLPHRKKSETIKMADGIPHLIITGTPDKETFIENYFKSLTNIFKQTANDSALVLSELLSEFYDIITRDEDAGKTLIKIKKEIKKIKSLTENPFVFLINNAREACLYFTKIFSENNVQNKAVIKNISDLRNRMNKLLGAVDTIETHQPLIGDCFIDENSSYLFFRTIKKVISREEYLRYDEVKKTLTDRNNEKASLYDREKEQLYAIFGELGSNTKTTQKTVLKKEKSAGRAELKPDLKPSVKPKLKQKPEKVIKQKRETAQPAKSEETHVPPEVTAAVRAKGKKRLQILKIIIPAAVIAILAFVLLLPPVSLLNRGFNKKINPDEKILIEEPVEEITPAETKTGPGVEEEVIAEDDLKQVETAKQPEETQGPEIDPEKLEVFLSLGYIQITILDVYNLANKIAIANGYKELDGVEQLGKNPDWIYPGNAFELPDTTEYTVVKGDTVWHITRQFIQKNVDSDWERYQQIIKEIKEENKDELIAELEDLKTGSYSENFSKEIEQAVSGLN